MGNVETTNSFGSTTPSRRKFLGQAAAGGGLVLGATTGLVTLDSLWTPASAIPGVTIGTITVPETGAELTGHSWAFDRRRYSKVTDTDGNVIGTFDISAEAVESDDPYDLLGTDNALSGIGEPIYGDSLDDDGDIAYHSDRVGRGSKPEIPDIRTLNGAEYVWNQTWANNYSGFQITRYNHITSPHAKLLQYDRYIDGGWRRSVASTSWANYNDIYHAALDVQGLYQNFLNELSLVAIVLGVSGHVFLTILTSRLGEIIETAESAEVFGELIEGFLTSEVLLGGVILLVVAGLMGMTIAKTYFAYYYQRKTLEGLLEDRPSWLL